MNETISKIPKPKYYTANSRLTQLDFNNIVTMDICGRLLSKNDMENENIMKYLKFHITQQEINNGEHEVYIHKTYTVHNDSEFLAKHTRRLCILYFYGKDEKYPYSRTFSLPSSELDVE
jgi:hypothetical protein